MIARQLATCLLALGLPTTLGCLKPNPLALEADQGEGESEDGSSDSSSDSDSDSSGDSDAPPSDLPETTSETTSDTDTTDSTETTETTGTQPCTAPPEFESECGACLAASCCTSLEPCGEDLICVCLADCLFAGESENTCRMLCGKKPSDVEPLAPLLACANQDCSGCFTE